MSSKRQVKLLFAFLLAAALGGSALGQGFQGTLRGDVQDQTGGVIPGATVTVTNVETGETRSQITTDAGTFNFPNLLVGAYTLEVEMVGFRRYARENIAVRANLVVEVRAVLELGEISDVVSVIAGAELVKTSTTQLEGTFTERDVVELPFHDPSGEGNPINLAVLMPGTTSQSGGVLGVGGSIGGNRPRQNNFVVDGVDNNNPSVTGPLTPVIQEAIAEFTLLTNQFSAEFGHSTAGQFITTTRSGTNEYRGRAWWHNQNRHFNALDNVTRAGTAPGEDKPRYDWNRFGGQMGGPIQRDRWFFFGSYEYRNLSLAGSPSGNILVPTSAGLSALQNLAQASGSGVSPTNVGILAQNVPTAATATQSASVLNEATGQMVPIELGPFAATTPNFDRTHLFLLSSDYQAGDHRLSGRFNFSRNRSIAAGPLPVTQFNSQPAIDTRRVTFSDVWTVSPMMVNEFRAGYNRLTTSFPLDLPAAPPGSDVFANYVIQEQSLNIGPSTNLPQSSFSNNYQFTNNLSWIRGAHSLKVGVEFRNYIASSFFLPRSRGEYRWTDLDAFVRDTFPTVVAIRGVGKGDFAQNRGAYYAFFQDTWRVHRRLTLELGIRYEYTQVARDTALQDLNGLANIGSIRDEVFTPELTSNPDLIGQRIFDTLPPHHQQVLLAHVGESLIFRAPRADRNNWAPRIGLAWDIFGDGRTSLRLGAGVAHDVIFGNLPLLLLPPQAQAENRESNACFLSPSPAWCGLAPGGNPLGPGADIRHATGGFIGGGALLPVLPVATLVDRFTARRATGAFVMNEVVPETYTWTASLQRQLFDHYLVEARYVGTRGVHLPVQRWKNAAVPNPAQLPIFLSETDALGHNYAGAPTLADFQANRGLMLAPYGFAGVMTMFTSDGVSWYHGGSFMLQRRFDRGLSFNANYTWSKTIDLIENELLSSFVNPRRPFDHLDIHANKGLSGLHREHKFALSWLWDLPGYRGGASFVNNFLSGWSINGTYLAEKGQPVTVLSFRDLNGDFDTAGDFAFENPAGARNMGTDVNFVCWDGTSASIASACAGAGQVVGYVAQDPSAQFVRGGEGAGIGVGLNRTGRGNVISPGINVVNLAVLKNTPLPGEGRSLQFGVSFNNLFNHPSFALGNGSALQLTGQATGFPGYVIPGGPQFLDETIFSGGLGNSPFQRVIQWTLRLDF